MKKGQLTIDFLIALTVALFILTALYAIIEIQQSTQNKVNAQTQLEQIAEKTASLITTTQILEDKNFSITTKIGQISFINSEDNLVSEYPSVNIDIPKNILAFSINTGKETYLADANFYVGAKTKITYNAGFMVITNAE